ncbi:hypothetical protein F383_27973 [Gossypium arboreum]|uniref:Uncharacterized protein n=1 Tax=Gossypium arboreum TaxID=29729 RepID=A0A0B0PD31_GOSAR|nr:hypothetical protein F383_27973 [Gossypium arboreum]
MCRAKSDIVGMPLYWKCSGTF